MADFRGNTDAQADTTAYFLIFEMKLNPRADWPPLRAGFFGGSLERFN